MNIKSSNFVIFILILVLYRSQASIQTSSSTSSPIPNSHCVTTNYKGICISCSVGYYLNLGYCYLVNPNCITYNMNNGACTSCGNNAMLEAPLCIIFSPTCADGSTGDCANCSDGYVSLSGFCVQISSFNLFCLNFTNNTCIDCMQGYYLSNGGCTFANPICSTYDMDNGSCTSCYSRYILVDGVCVSLISINPHGLIYIGQAWTQCNNGYFLNSNGVCIFANTFCASYDSKGQCLTCNQGSLNGPLCLVSTNCSNTDMNGNCLSCASGFIQWNSECVSLVSLFPFCAIFSGQSCLTCKSGSYLLNGACLVENPFCATYDSKGNCRSCNQGNFFASPLCLVVSPTCATVDQNGNCLTCQPQYQLYANQCVSLSSLYPFCSAFSNSTCVCCLLGYFLNNGVCIPVNPLCFTYEMSSGICLSCYSGFGVWGSTCVDLTNISPHCTTFSGVSCTKCQSGYMIANGACIFANPNCASYDIAGGCSNCSQGYLSGSLCLVSADCLNTDQSGNCIVCPNDYTPWGSGCVSLSSLYPFCSAFANSSCTDCSYGYYFDGIGCTIANPFCATSDINGYCINCNQGYILSGTLCVVISTICKTSNATTNICTSCQAGFVLYEPLCVSESTLDPFCLTFSGEVCVNCVLGYYLENGTCTYPSQNCLTSDNNTGKCLSCYPQYFLNHGQCMSVNPLCQTYTLNGDCTNCFAGYFLEGYACVAVINLNPLCLNFSGSLCINCKVGYYVGIKSICTTANPLCLTYNMANGVCITCVAGYILQNGMCLSLGIINPNCLTFNLTKCVSCNIGYYVGIKSICTPANPLCLTYNMTDGVCITCGPGYILQNGMCLALAVINPNCLAFNLTRCINCKVGYYVGIKSICTTENPLCLTYNMTDGVCITCGPGYILQNGMCLSLTIINPNCLAFNLTKCLNCKVGYYVGIKSICTPENPLCLTYNMTDGVCITCGPGYILQNGMCLALAVINPNCLAFNLTKCLNCKVGYYVGIKSICTPVNPLCLTYNMINGGCLSCNAGFHLQWSTCI